MTISGTHERCDSIGINLREFLRIDCLDNDYILVSKCWRLVLGELLCVDLATGVGLGERELAEELLTTRATMEKFGGIPAN